MGHVEYRRDPELPATKGGTLIIPENPVGRKSGITLAKNYGPRTWKALAVFVAAACVVIHGQSSPKQIADPAVAALGSGFVSDTAQVNGTILHYVLGRAGP